MRADWTRPNPAIAAYLKRFGRYGIPFNAVYGPAARWAPLPEMLTPDAVTTALPRPAGKARRVICAVATLCVRPSFKKPGGTAMTITVGDKIPSAKLKTMTAEGPKDISTDEIFKGKKVVLFAVPGAFTPTCSAKHLPGFVEKSAEIKSKGVEPSPASPSTMRS